MHIIHKAGASVNATAITEAYTNDFIAQAEGIINTASMNNWSDSYSTLNPEVRSILTSAASDQAAMYAINYDVSGYVGSQADTMLNFLRDDFDRNINLLKEAGKKDFINGA